MEEPNQQERQRIKEMERTLAIGWHQQHSETGNVYARAAIDFGLEAIRTAALINGGAVIACLAFLGTLHEASAVSQGLLKAVWFGAALFVVGAVLAGGASFLAYFAQYFYTHQHNAVKLTWEHPYEVDRASKKWLGRIAFGFHGLAAVAVIASYSIVIFGAVEIYSARG